MDPVRAVPGNAGKAAAAPPELEALLAGCELRELPKGYLFSTPANERNEVFVVRSGRLRVYLAGENRELSLSFLEPGDIYTTHTPTYIKTVTLVVLSVMDMPAFARKLTTGSAIGSTMMRVMGRLLTNAVTLIEDLAFREVPARLARYLLALVERRGERCPEGWIVPLDVSIEDLASLLGATRQTVSSLVNNWERDGIFQRQGRNRLLVRSLDDLAAHCFQDF